MRRLHATFENDSCGFLAGYGSREILTELRGRPPVWATLTRAWVTTPATLRDAIAIAERRGYEVVIIKGEAADPGAGRW